MCRLFICLLTLACAVVAGRASAPAPVADENHAVMGKLEIPPTTIGKVADHIEHIRRVAGVAHVGIGADYDGNDRWPQGLEDVSSYPKLFAELIRRGWTDRELKMLAGENVLRVLERAESVASELQKSTAASLMQFKAGS